MYSAKSAPSGQLLGRAASLCRQQAQGGQIILEDRTSSRKAGLSPFLQP